MFLRLNTIIQRCKDTPRKKSKPVASWYRYNLICTGNCAGLRVLSSVLRKVSENSSHNSHNWSSKSESERGIARTRIDESAHSQWGFHAKWLIAVWSTHMLMKTQVIYFWESELKGFSYKELLKPKNSIRHPTPIEL